MEKFDPKNVLEILLEKIDVYSRENLPDKNTLDGISSLFLNNYPTMYSEDLKEKDFERYNSAEKIEQQIKDKNFFITSALEDKIIGMIKFRKEARLNISESEEWLVSWIMVDKPYRQLKLKVAEKMFEEFLGVLREMKEKSKKRTFAVADVKKDNLASIFVCKKFGFSEKDGKSPEYFLFYKEI